MRAFLPLPRDPAALRPITERKPAPLVELNGRPLVARLLEGLRSAGVRAAAVECREGADELVRYLASEFPDLELEVVPAEPAWAGDEALVVPTDLAVDPEVLQRLARAPGPAAACRGGRPIGARRGAAAGAAELSVDDLRCAVLRTVDDLVAAEVLFNPRLPELAEKRVFFLDRDGTLSLRERKLPGVDEFIARLRARGRRPIVVTNNSSRTPHRHLQNFRAMGLDLEPRDVLVSIDPAVDHLVERGLLRVYWVATREVGEYLASRGLRFDDRDPQALLLTYDTEIDYPKLERLTHLVRRGLPYLATHVDVVCPTAEGGIPDVGTFAKVIEMATGARPERTFGKPELHLVEPVLRRAGLGLGDAVIVGDRLYTDIRMACGNALTSVLVLTGETTRTQYEFDAVRADVVVPGLAALVPWV